MDEKDKKILNILQSDGRAQFNHIAEKVGLSNAAVHARVIKLERSGVITGYRASLDHTQFGRDIHAIIKITVDHSKDKPEKTLSDVLKIKKVTSVYALTGEWDYHIEVLVKNMTELRKVTTSIIKKAIPHMIRSDTSMVLEYKKKPLDI